MTKFTFSAALAAIVAGPALAGGVADPVETPVPMAPPPVVAPMSADWTGFYAGGSIGTYTVDPDEDGIDDIDGNSFGVHGGYNYDLGNIVVGGELDYSRLMSDDDEDSDVNITRLKGRLGYDAGSFLPYVTAGFARADSDDIEDSENGSVYGVGADFAVTDNVLVGGEYLRHDFEDLEADVDTLSLRASYKF